AAWSPSHADRASPAAQAVDHSSHRSAASGAPAAPRGPRTPAGRESGAGCCHEPATQPSHTLNRRAAPPPAPPVPRPASVAPHAARAANSRRHTPPSHPAGTYNPLRPRPTPVCCLDTNNSARSAVRLSLSWEKNLFLRGLQACELGGPVVGDAEDAALRVPVAQHDALAGAAVHAKRVYGGAMGVAVDQAPDAEAAEQGGNGVGGAVSDVGRSRGWPGFGGPSAAGAPRPPGIHRRQQRLQARRADRPG